MKLGTLLEHPPRAPLKARQAIRDRFAQLENITLSDGDHPCWRMLLTGTCPGWLYAADHAPPPGSDHAEMWVRANGSYALTFQPYSDSFDAGKRRELELWCVARGLTWKEMPELSWHYPNWTTLVLIDHYRRMSEWMQTGRHRHRTGKHRTIAGIPEGKVVPLL